MSLSVSPMTTPDRLAQIRDRMTPGELADRLEKLTPGTRGIKLVDILRWQQANGKQPVNIRWYVERMCAEELPQPRKTPDAQANLARLRRLTGGIG